MVYSVFVPRQETLRLGRQGEVGTYSERHDGSNRVRLWYGGTGD